MVVLDSVLCYNSPLFPVPQTQGPLPYQHLRVFHSHRLYAHLQNDNHQIHHSQCLPQFSVSLQHLHVIVNYLSVGLLHLHGGMMLLSQPLSGGRPRFVSTIRNRQIM